MNSNPPSPLPARIKRRGTHECAHSDILVLLEDVRQARRRRWWLTTVIVMALVGALGSLGWAVFDGGQRVGEAQRDLEHLRAAEVADRRAIAANAAEILRQERTQAVRDQELRTVLIRLDARLERIEEAVSQRRGGRRR